MHRFLRRFRIAVPATIAVLLAPSDSAVAQVGTDVLAQQSLRPYWYVFIAYSLVWILLMGWVVSIARRMSKLDDAGTDGGGAQGLASDR